MMTEPVFLDVDKSGEIDLPDLVLARYGWGPGTDLLC